MNYLHTFKSLFLGVVYNSGIWRTWRSLKFSLSFIRLHCEPCWGLCICPSNNETPFQHQTPGYNCVIMVVGDMLWALPNTSTSMCPVFAMSLINHFDTSRSPMGSHIDIWYVPLTLFGLLLYCAQISLLAWTYFFQNKVLKVRRSFIIILCVSGVYSMLTCIEYQNYHQTLHFFVEVVVLILIQLQVKCKCNISTNPIIGNYSTVPLT
jgi:hypothetical protein